MRQLVKAMFGTCEAVHHCQRECSVIVQELGSSTGRVSPHHFYYSKGDMRGMVRGDDFACVGQDKDLQNIAAQMAALIKVKAAATGHIDAAASIGRQEEYDAKRPGSLLEEDSISPANPRPSIGRPRRRPLRYPLPEQS